MYTKGEWKAWKGEVKPDRWGVYAGDDGGIGIAKMLDENQLANANLIAAAPAIYEALIAIYQDIDLQNVTGGSDELNIIAQQALAKAES